MNRLVTLCALALVASPATALELTFDPADVGQVGDAFTFDALEGFEISRIDNTFGPDGSFSFSELGYLSITSASLGGTPVATGGLNSTYSLYMLFTSTGSAPNFFTPGGFDTANITFFAAPGVASFAFDAGNNAQISGIGTPTQVLTGSVTGGSLASTIVSPPPALALDLSATIDLALLYDLPGVFGSPNPLRANIDAFHDSSTVQVLDFGAVFLVNGGPNILTFAVPAPAALALFGPLAAMLFAARRRAR